MKFLAALTVVALMASCSKEPQVPSNWATETQKATDDVDPSCKKDADHKLTEPKGGSGSDLARFGNGNLDEYARLKADYQKCATWALGQRK